MRRKSKLTKTKDKPRSIDNLKTRQVILELLKLKPSSAQTLAKELKVTGMAVRQHLYQLVKEKMVTFSEPHRSIGRPNKIWSLTAEAAKFFPDAHATLALQILDNVKLAFGPESIAKLVDARTTQQIDLYRQRVLGLNSLKDRLITLAKIRTEEGYMADVVSDSGDSFLLLEHHCPICSAASACRGLCDSELTVFRALVEDLASVERVDHILAGATRCAYRVVPKS
jgi:predicted ArsR family transcriptional regulator